MSNKEALVKAAISIRNHAYAPYSTFWVGAAILSDDGNIYTGCNVENSAYPQGSCAEAGAISNMIAGGGRYIKEIAISGALKDRPTIQATEEILCTPCGACRQRIREFAQSDCPIHICDATKFQRSFTLDALLPFSFGPDNL